MTFAVNAAIWSTNVVAAVSLIFTVKLLLSRTGFTFAFPISLCALHYITVAVVLQLYKWTGSWTSSQLGWQSKALYVGVSCTSIVSLNVSLMVNQVGFYQISKLAVIPFVACVEALVYQRRFSPVVVASMATVLVGVGLVTVSSVAVSVTGMAVALVSIVAAGSQQLLCGHMQRAHGVGSTDMLLQTAWPMGGVLLLAGPVLDHGMSGKWVHEQLVNATVNLIIGVSCLLAVAVNVSQFLCLGRFSAVAYQVMGHSKTVCVLLGGALFFHEAISLRAGIGMALAVVGMVGYGYFSNREKAAAPPAAPGDAKAASELKQSLLQAAK